MQNIYSECCSAKISVLFLDVSVNVLTVACWRINRGNQIMINESIFCIFTFSLRRPIDEYSPFFLTRAVRRDHCLPIPIVFVNRARFFRVNTITNKHCPPEEEFLLSADRYAVEAKLDFSLVVEQSRRGTINVQIPMLIFTSRSYRRADEDPKEENTEKLLSSIIETQTKAHKFFQ